MAVGVGDEPPDAQKLPVGAAPVSATMAISRS
jgi:hypothetical protein